MDVFLAGAVFLVAYGLIASERFDRTLIALFKYGLGVVVASLLISTVYLWLRYLG